MVIVKFMRVIYRVVRAVSVDITPFSGQYILDISHLSYDLIIEPHPINRRGSESLQGERNSSS
jgi:hypothetical protein